VLEKFLNEAYRFTEQRGNEIIISECTSWLCLPKNNFPQLYRHAIRVNTLFGRIYVCAKLFKKQESFQMKTEEQSYALVNQQLPLLTADGTLVTWSKRQAVPDTALTASSSELSILCKDLNHTPNLSQYFPFLHEHGFSYCDRV
jgi:hypothetical protein